MVSSCTAYPQPVGVVKPLFTSVSTVYSAPLLRGVSFNPQNPLGLEFIIDSADSTQVSEEEAGELIEYFLAGLTLPDKDLWVNLSPYEKDRICADTLAETGLGENMLSQDYILKQLSAGLTHPDTPAGRAYWHNKQNLKCDEQNLLAKIWIVPGSAEITEGKMSAYVTEAKLKVMTDHDYVATNRMTGVISDGNTDAFKRHILPMIERDVNEGKNFSRLRQAYYALVLAVWFKQKFQDSFYQAYIDKSKVDGIALNDKTMRENIYVQYVEAFKRGTYDVTKNFSSHFNKITKRRYFCGGEDLHNIRGILTSKAPDGTLPVKGTLMRLAATVDEVDYANFKNGYRMAGKPKARIRKNSHLYKSGSGFMRVDKIKNFDSVVKFLMPFFSRLNSDDAETFTRALLTARRDTLHPFCEEVWQDNYADFEQALLDMDLDRLKRLNIGLFFSNINAQKIAYMQMVNRDGKRLLSDRQVSYLLYERLIPATYVEYLAQQGFTGLEIESIAKRRMNIDDYVENFAYAANILSKAGIEKPAALAVYILSWPDIIDYIDALSASVARLKLAVKDDDNIFFHILLGRSLERVRVILQQDFRLTDSQINSALEPLVINEDKYGVTTDLHLRSDVKGVRFIDKISNHPRLLEEYSYYIANRSNGALAYALTHASSDLLYGSLRRFHDPVNDIIIERIKRYEPFDMNKFLVSFSTESRLYREYRDKQNRPVFSEEDLVYLLYIRLVPFVTAKAMFQAGISVAYIKNIVGYHTDINRLWDENNDLFGELRYANWSPHDAMHLILGKNPREKYSVIRDVMAQLDSLSIKFGFKIRVNTMRDLLINGGAARIAKIIADTYKISLADAQAALQPLADYEAQHKSDRPPKETSYKSTIPQDGGVNFRQGEFKINTKKYSGDEDISFGGSDLEYQGLNFTIETITPITNQQALEYFK